MIDFSKAVEELNKVLSEMIESVSEILSSHNIKFKINTPINTLPKSR